MLEKVNDCCNFAFGAMDGAYGWLNETIAILLFVIFFNFFVKWALKKLHQRFERQRRAWSDGFVKALYLPLSCYVWFFAIVHAVDLISHNFFQVPLFSYMHTVLEIGAVLALYWFLMRWKKNVVRFMNVLSKNREIAFDQSKIDAVDKVLTVLLAFLTILVLLEITDRSVNTLIAFGGVGGLAVAIASQEIIANFFGGLMIYFTQPFTIGDWINLPEKDIEGTVEEIGWYMTRVRTFEKRPIYIPNSVFSKIIVMTPSRMSHREIKLVIGLRYSDFSKIKVVMSEIKTMLQQHPEIDHSQNIIVRFTAFGHYSLDILVQAFSPIIDTVGFVRIQEDVLFNISDILEKNGCEMAMPTHQIVMER